MKTILKILFLSGIIGITAFSCGNEKQPRPNPLPTDHLTAKEAFPNQVGDRWTYSVLDTINKTTQTVVMRISRDSFFKNGKTYKIWQYRLFGKNRTNYVNITADTVGIFNSNSIHKTYLFPLYLNKSWTGPGKCKVIKIETVTVPAGTFKNCYVIHRVSLSYNYRLDEYVWLKPHVGIIKRQTFEYNFAPPTYRVWKLTDYHLVN